MKVKASASAPVKRQQIDIDCAATAPRSDHAKLLRRAASRAFLVKMANLFGNIALVCPKYPNTHIASTSASKNGSEDVNKLMAAPSREGAMREDKSVHHSKPRRQQQ